MNEWIVDICEKSNFQRSSFGAFYLVKINRDLTFHVELKMFSERIYRILMNFLRAIIRFNCNLLRTWISTEMMNLYIFWNNTLNTLLNKLLKGGPINWHFLNEFWLSFHVQLLINFRNWHHFHSLSRYHRHFFTF